MLGLAKGNEVAVLQAMPQMILWDGPSIGREVEAHFEEFEGHINSGDATPIVTLPGNVIVYDAHQKGVAFALQDKEVVFFVRYHIETNDKKTFITQDEIWLNPFTSDENKALKIPGRVFLEALLPKCGRMVCDSQQTRQGRDFWLARCHEAIKRGYKVSTWNFATGAVARMAKAQDIPMDIWGDHEIHRHRRVMIEAHGP